MSRRRFVNYYEVVEIEKMVFKRPWDFSLLFCTGNDVGFFSGFYARSRSIVWPIVQKLSGWCKREKDRERERERERERDLAHWTVDAVSLARALTVFVRGALHLFVRPMLSSDKATWTSNSYEPNVAPNKLHIPKFLKLNLEFQQSLCIFVFFSLINYFWMISLINLIN